MYITTNTSVPSWFPGTWTEVDADRFLKAVGSSGTTGNFNASNTGSTTLTAAQSGVPAHSHGLNSHTHSIPQLNIGGYFNTVGGGNQAFTLGPIGTQSAALAKTTASTTGAASGSTANNTATAASEGHNHTPGNPKGYGVHVFVRTA